MVEQQYDRKPWMSRVRWAYLIIVTLCGLADGIAFCFPPKPDTAVIAILAFINGSVIIMKMKFMDKKIVETVIQHSPEQQSDTNFQKYPLTAKSASPTISENDDYGITNTESVVISQKPKSRSCKFCRGFWVIGIRILMVLHAFFVIISVAGAIELALLYRYYNP